MADVRDRLVGVYAIVLLSTGRQYIGSSKDIKRRTSGHLSSLDAGTHHCAHLQRAWAKHGRSSFCVFVIEICAEEELKAREQVHINACSLLYNSTRHVDRPLLGRTMSASARAHLSALNTGRKLSETTRAKISQAQAGRQCSDETSAKISAALLARGDMGSWNKGKRRPASVGIKVSAALTGRQPSVEARKKMSDAARCRTRESMLSAWRSHSTMRARANASIGRKRAWDAASAEARASFKATMKLAMTKWWAERKKEGMHGVAQ